MKRLVFILLGTLLLSISLHVLIAEETPIPENCVKYVSHYTRHPKSVDTLPDKKYTCSYDIKKNQYTCFKNGELYIKSNYKSVQDFITERRVLGIRTLTTYYVRANKSNALNLLFAYDSKGRVATVSIQINDESPRVYKAVAWDDKGRQIKEILEGTSIPLDIREITYNETERSVTYTSYSSLDTELRKVRTIYYDKDLNYIRHKSEFGDYYYVHHQYKTVCSN